MVEASAARAYPKRAPEERRTPKGTTTVDPGLALQKAPPHDVLDELERVARPLRRNAGDYLFRQGDSRLDEVFVLLTATAEVLVGPPDAERSASLAGPGQLLGFLSVFSEERSPPPRASPSRARS